jgi:mono/diheme cytochrome c family protein
MTVTRAAILVFIPLIAMACGRSAEDTGTASAVDGEAIYTRTCASCHGLQGDGQGPAAYLLFPKPRNFQAANYKLRSSPQGSLPTDADLQTTIRTGMPGTPMLGFGELLSDAEIDGVIGYIKTFSPRFAETGPPAPDELLALPEPPEVTSELVAEGREAYDTMRCGQCHGPEGRGDGLSAPTLRDSEGQPFPAADFTQGIYKSGGGSRELYRTMLTGMSGTPMPSYADALQSERQAWAIVAYLESLAPSGTVRPAAGDPGPLTVATVADEGLLGDPVAAGWGRLEPHRVYMRPLWYRSRYPLFVEIRVARVGDRLGLLLEWDDPSHDTATIGQQAFGDGVAVELSAADPPPFVGMGAGPDGEVEIWFWRADRQHDADANAVTDMPDAHPDMAVDGYPFTRGLQPNEGGGAAEAFAAGQEAPFVSGRDVDNPVSQPEMLRRPVHTLRAAGLGTATAPGVPGQRATGRGIWTDGTYRVLITAPLAPPPDVAGLDLTARQTIPLAVAAWDGAAGDRNGTKLVSQWITLQLGAGGAASGPGGE